jgi:hypothetical protein
LVNRALSVPSGTVHAMSWDLTHDTVEDLRRAAALGSSAVVLLSGASHAAADRAFAVVVEAALPPRARPTDAVRLSPATGRWRAEEVDQLRSSFTLTPIERYVVGVFEVHRMDPAAVDRLLKLFEEPPAPTLFVLTAPTPDDLAPTMRSRLTAHIPVAVAVDPALSDRLAALGLHPRLATRPLTASLVASLEAAGDLERLASVVASATSTPATAAFDLAKTLDALAVSSGDDPRRAKGELARLVLEHFRLGSVDVVAAGGPASAVAALAAATAAVEANLISGPQLCRLLCDLAPRR